MQADPRLKFATKPLRYALAIAALAIVYLVAARAGLMLDAVAGFASLVWAPSGLALTTLLIFGSGLWPGVFIGAFLANLLTGAPVPVALGIGVGNTLEAVLAVYALRRIPGFQVSLERLADVIGLIVLGAGLSTMVSASIGVASLYLGGIASLLVSWVKHGAHGGWAILSRIFSWPRFSSFGRLVHEGLIIRSARWKRSRWASP